MGHEDFPLIISKTTGLPVYEDGRRFDVDYKNRLEFSLTELEVGREVTLGDDKGREYHFRVGQMSEIEVTTKDGKQIKVRCRMISGLSGDGLTDKEKIQTCLYDEDGGLNVRFFPPREPNQISPAKSKGLRLVVNPWYVLPLAVEKIVVT